MKQDQLNESGPRVRPLQIAIDGPVAAGKSTVAQRLAGALGFVYVDTGAMYRAVTLMAQERSVSLDNEQGLVDLVSSMDIDVKRPEGTEVDGRTSTVLVDGRDLSWGIRDQKVSDGVATVAAWPKVREVLVAKQQEIARKRSVVMEGRDITYVVLPEADLKIYLDADEGVRAERYYHKIKSQGTEIDLTTATESLKARDELDKNRETSPLKIVEGVWHFDSSDLSIDGVLEKIVSRVEEMIENRG